MPNLTLAFINQFGTVWADTAGNLYSYSKGRYIRLATKSEAKIKCLLRLEAEQQADQLITELAA